MTRTFIHVFFFHVKKKFTSSQHSNDFCITLTLHETVPKARDTKFYSKFYLLCVLFLPTFYYFLFDLMCKYNKQNTAGHSIPGQDFFFVFNNLVLS